ncbi:unnamed protein product, partial [Prorocentrum cordatum]
GARGHSDRSRRGASTRVHSHLLARVRPLRQGVRAPASNRLSPGFPAPWVRDENCAAGLRVVLPTAKKMRLCWGPLETSWHDYASADNNNVGDLASLAETRERLASILRDEVARLGGDARRVFLGGLSQGCTAALDVYLREGPTLGLGGFVGSVGFLPSDADGFEGADEALERFLADAEQSRRPLWLQSAEDDQWVPWEGLVEPSLRRLRGRAPGLRHRTVRGRGHVIEEWEGDLLNEFVREHAGEAF